MVDVTTVKLVRQLSKSLGQGIVALKGWIECCNDEIFNSVPILIKAVVSSMTILACAVMFEQASEALYRSPPALDQLL